MRISVARKQVPIQQYQQWLLPMVILITDLLLILVLPLSHSFGELFFWAFIAMGLPSIIATYLTLTTRIRERTKRILYHTLFPVTLFATIVKFIQVMLAY